MKKLITVFLLLICVSISFSQSKKQQIETLTYKLDSINSVLLRSIDDNKKLSDTKLVLESKISLLKNENASKNGEISLLKKENSSKNGEISLLKKENSSKNEEISLLKKENSSKLNVGLCYSNHKTDEYQKYVLIQINNRLYELSVNGYPYAIICHPDDNNLEITSKAEELSDFCESYNITEKLNQLLKVNFQRENWSVFWLLNESTNKIEVFSIIEGEGWDGKTELIGTFSYNPD